MRPGAWLVGALLLWAVAGLAVPPIVESQAEQRSTSLLGREMRIGKIGFSLGLAGLGRFANALGYGAAAFYAVRANIDCYKKMVLKQNGWW